MTQRLTHIDAEGDARMVDVSEKAETKRTAIAEGFVAMQPETLAVIESRKKGRRAGSRTYCRHNGSQANQQPYTSLSSVGSH